MVGYRDDTTAICLQVRSNLDLAVSSTKSRSVSSSRSGPDLDRSSISSYASSSSVYGCRVPTPPPALPSDRSQAFGSEPLHPTCTPRGRPRPQIPIRAVMTTAVRPPDSIGFLERSLHTDEATPVLTACSQTPLSRRFSQHPVSGLAGLLAHPQHWGV